MVSDLNLISSPIVLPNGAVVPNRLVKAAMEEGIGTGGGLPGKHHQRLYSRWAEGVWGMIITGEDIRAPWY
jgi:2,4-dienoyl-CoA reductase-like NADH-dependent reductase (Old Yellow Enzyme family)